MEACTELATAPVARIRGETEDIRGIQIQSPTVLKAKFILPNFPFCPLPPGEVLDA